MKPRSCKNKGKKLQNLVRDLILKHFPSLTSRDVKSTTMGEAGVDIQLSEFGWAAFPYDVECKNLAKVAVYKYYEQVTSRPGAGEPLVIVKQNNSNPLAIISLDHFMELVYEYRQRN